MVAPTLATGPVHPCSYTQFCMCSMQSVLLAMKQDKVLSKGACGGRAGANKAASIYQPHITSYDYDCPVGEAGGYGQPGIGGPNKFEVRQLPALNNQCTSGSMQRPTGAAWPHVDGAAENRAVTDSRAKRQLANSCSKLAQLIRDLITDVTGEEPPDAPPPPVLCGYGPVTLDEGALLLEELGAFVPGDGIAVDRPDIMEEYGQSCAALLAQHPLAQHVVHVV